MNRTIFVRFIMSSIFFISLNTGLISQEVNTELENKNQLIQSFVNAYIKNNPAFTGSILVGLGNEILYTSGFGFSNFEDKISNSSQTQYRIASITKPFTATSILILEKDGLLRIEDKLSKYIPDYPKGDSISIYNLLTMTSGIPNYNNDYGEGLPEEELRKLLDREYKPLEIIEIFKYKELNFDPGTEFEYSNSNYVLLGWIIEKVSGMTYQNFVKSRIFSTIGMDSSSFIDHDVTKETAIGYTSNRINRDTYTPVEYYKLEGTFAYSAGSITSTVLDMFKWSSALYSEKLLSKNSLEKMYLDTPYAFGWHVDNSRGKVIVFHGGSIEGFESMIIRNLNIQSTVIILTNKEFSDVGRLSNGLQKIVEE